MARHQTLLIENFEAAEMLRGGQPGGCAGGHVEPANAFASFVCEQLLAASKATTHYASVLYGS
jgi:hypothetical protein